MTDSTPDPAPEETSVEPNAQVVHPRAPRKTLPRAAQVAWPLAAIGAISVLASQQGAPPPTTATAPAPVVAQQEVQWWAAFKLNATVFPTAPSDPGRSCPFGGDKQAYKASLQYAFATSQDPVIKAGQNLIGVGPDDPLGATYARMYNGAFHYVVWNDQFKGAIKAGGCTGECGSPWGHSKGMMAWNDAGEGMVLQVTTPGWPRAGGAQHPATDGVGDTLGCIQGDDDIEFSQDFFALKLTKDDVVQVLHALANSSVVTDPANPQLVSNGGPDDIRALVQTLGVKSQSQSPINTVLSSGVRLISKPSALHYPPWQLVSAELGGVPLKVANWWTEPAIPSTDAGTKIGCPAPSLPTPGAVVNVTFGQWDGKRMGLQGGGGPLGGNHGKIGVSSDGVHSYAIFGDMNQQGSLGPDRCNSSQNGRGGMFFVVDNAQLAASVSQLLTDPSTPNPT